MELQASCSKGAASLAWLSLLLGTAFMHEQGTASGAVTDHLDQVCLALSVV